MPKGPKPPKPPPDRFPSDDPANPDFFEPICWTFSPENQTDVARRLAAGDKLEAVVLNTRIQITCDRGAVGTAPANEARKILELLRASDRRLAGHVISNEAGVLIVQICVV